MDIQAEKYLLIERLKLVKDAALLQAIKSMLDYGLKNEEERITIDQYNQELEQAEQDIENGLGMSNEELKRESSTW